ncbi:ornithine carbamoyltransferase [Bacillus cytotoxicus]|uniref:Ornithine carbamoyltransferase n=1 Tax=Bacillus cytotoxicus (strain DSM 22905 / CIP 110041 / 391-98 / NVH 391-98) TaxID=315749 RepID=A7GSF0_BACCN|nr:MULTISPECIES: ornithine carbamoyltransferase [Bacillus cereus group]ABS23058.1 ornithine carbamoyltransferase [Bacillus cytotoxicus NVH 391-98]AWC33714.1 ornithine carbamoyltransferase [Bacillus cytotoxicus]AWC37693.1 ornithine carbamoyltransferase [Bacillus cytotoxicus]AWC45687.1 ornithine carbamoyltransferase [Bacillus cytotoxicus]AWC61915.1 ornithine carbamoyltransferase [Bacillus cytotoxicus]
MSIVQVPKLQTKHVLTLEELTQEEIISVIKFAIYLKKNKHEPFLKGKILGLIFDKQSTRTRVSFEAGMMQLGGHGMFLSGKDMQLGRGESIADTAKVLSKYIDGIMIRTFSHADVEELAKKANIPVINGLTDDHHPCQALADLMTIYEEVRTFKGIKLAYIGDGNNVCHSLLVASAKVGMDMAVATPRGYEPNGRMIQKALEIAEETGAKLEFFHAPQLAVAEADFVYTDVWMSMGQEGAQEKKVIFQPFQINCELVQYAKKTYRFLHCLPAHRGEEVTSEIIDGMHSIVFTQAENRLHAQKALLVSIFENMKEPS